MGVWGAAAPRETPRRFGGRWPPLRESFNSVHLSKSTRPLIFFTMCDRRPMTEHVGPQGRFIRVIECFVAAVHCKLRVENEAHSHLNTKPIVPCSTVALFACAMMEPQTEGAEAWEEEEEPRTLVSKVHACLCSHGSAPACLPNSIRLASGHASAIPIVRLPACAYLCKDTSVGVCLCSRPTMLVHEISACSVFQVSAH